MKPCRILVVEDEAIVAMDIRDRLAALGYESAGRAVSGEQALSIVRDKRPDLVLMDIRLRGEMDGVETASEIRRSYHIPVIFLTAYSEDATLERAKLTEPFGYLLKPFDDRELKSAIEIALYKHIAEEEIRRLNRLYNVLSQVNQAVVRLNSRNELLSTVCRLMVERAAVDFAWIGWIEPESGEILPVAWCGSRGEALREAGFFSASGEGGDGNARISVREKKSSFCNECVDGGCPNAVPVQPSRFGFRSCGSFPLWFRGEVHGILNLCNNEPGFFREREVELLEEVAADVSFALDKIASDAERERLSAQYLSQCSFLQTLMDAVPHPVFYKDKQFRYLGCNTAFERFIGMNRKEVIGRRLPDLWAPDLAAVHERADVTLLGGSGPETIVYEAAVQSADGCRHDVVLHKAVFGGRGVEGLIGVIQDVTESKMAERALRRSEQRLAMALAASRMGVWEWDARTDKSFWSPECLEILKLDDDCATFDSFLEMVHPDDIARAEDMRRKVREGRAVGPEDFRVVGPRGDGERWVSCIGEPEYDEKGKVLRVVGTVQDITDRKDAEEVRSRVDAQLRQAQKMEALGTLAGGIAHDFNNILGIIIGYTEMAAWDIDEDRQEHKCLQQVLKASSRAKDLVQQILAFSRLGDQEKKPVQVGLIVKEAMKMLRASLPSTIEIKMKVSARAAVLADPTQIHQVLMNLCTNAAHAMRDNGGVLDVSLTEESLQPETIPPHMGLAPGSCVKLVVRDTGHGIASAFLDRIFEPFFTTKEPGAGTGLGLAVVHGIVENHGGVINVESQPGKGACFEVILPALENTPLQEPLNVESIPRGRERILVVDDEPALAASLKEMLDRLGYSVESRTDSREALEFFRSRLIEAPFDLVITDMTMPRLTGEDLAVELLRTRPGMPILICTGFSEKMDAERAKAMGIRGFFMKPALMGTLARMVRDALDEKVERRALIR